MKKLLSLFLVMMLLAGMVPAALADGEPIDETPAEEAVEEIIDETAEEIPEVIPEETAAETAEEEAEEIADGPAGEPAEEVPGAEVALDESGADGSGEPSDEPADGPEDIWAAITALEEAAGAYAPGDYDALLPEVEAVILSSPAYVEGTLEYRDGILFWWSDGVLNGYSGEARAQNNGYAAFYESSPYLTALLEDQLALIEADMAEAPALDGAGDPGGDVAVFCPYAGTSNHLANTASVSESLGSMLVFRTGGESHAYEGSAATIDALADALESCCVVFIDTHGTNSGYICLRTGSGITEADMEGNHAYKGGDFWAVDGTAIVNHMEKKANDCLVWCCACQGMKTDRTCGPLRQNGVAVMVGFSESVSTSGALAFASAFLYNMANRGSTAAEAFDLMRQACACDWDPLYPNYTLEQAQRYGVAFPVLVSAQDPYPGAGYVSVVQDPKCTWTLPRNQKDYLPDYSTSSQTITVNTSAGDYIAPVKTTETFKNVVFTSGALPKGMSWSWSGHELHFKGTPTEKGYFSAFFTITTQSGKVYEHGAYFMVRDSKVVTSSQSATVTAPAGTDRYYLTAKEQYYISLDFPSDTTTWSMGLISGYLPASLDYGFSDGAMGYVRSVSNVSKPGTYLATAPGTYRITLEIINYSGDVFRHTLNLTVKPATVTAMDPISISTTQYKEYAGRLTDNDDYFDVNSIECIGGSLPDGMFVADSYLRRFGVYGTPTEAGDFTATYWITGYNNAYTYTFNVHVAEASLPSVQIVEANFPDYWFREYVRSYLDTDDDNFLSAAEREAVTEIDIDNCDNQSYYWMITSLEGIKYFPNLEYLICGSGLKSLDLSGNTKLIEVRLNNNDAGGDLVSLNVRGCTQLEVLSLFDNQVSSLDLSTNLMLQELGVEGNKLKSLDLSKNPLLESLSVSYNQGLTKLDLSANKKLRRLYIRGSGLSSIDLTVLPALEALYCENCSMTTLNVTKNTALTRLDCSNNNLKTLDVTKNTKLTYLNCKNNALTSLDISKCPALKQLNCVGNKLTALDLTKNTALSDLSCYGTDIKALDITNCPNLHIAYNSDYHPVRTETVGGREVTYTFYSGPGGNVLAAETSVKITGGEQAAPTVKLSADGKSAQASGDFTGLYARVALVIQNGSASGLYVTQVTINPDGAVVIPSFMVPGLSVRGVNIALVPTLADISSSTPNAKASDFKML